MAVYILFIIGIHTIYVIQNIVLKTVAIIHVININFLRLYKGIAIIWFQYFFNSLSFNTHFSITIIGKTENKTTEI